MSSRSSGPEEARESSHGGSSGPGPEGSAGPDQAPTAQSEDLPEPEPPPPPPPPPGLPSPWGTHSLVEGETLALRLGARDLWLRWRDGEIWLSEEDRGVGSGEFATWGSGSPPTGPGKEAEWTRWATPAGERDVLLRPTLPDRPLVLEPEWPFRLLPGAEARVFVRVPLWVRIEVRLGSGEGGGSRSVKLTELPTVVMSDTWWGELHQGELAYWLPTTARRAMAPRLFAPHLGVCPLVMQNRADEDLQVEKVALRVDHLSLFASEGRIWSDESRVVYQGAEAGSRIDMTGKAPSEAGDADLVVGPRMPVQRGFTARTFDRLRALHGLGGGV